MPSSYSKFTGLSSDVGSVWPWYYTIWAGNVRCLATVVASWGAPTSILTLPLVGVLLVAVASTSAALLRTPGTTSQPFLCGCLTAWPGPGPS
jgi:hypothetical protein